MVGCLEAGVLQGRIYQEGDEWNKVVDHYCRCHQRTGLHQGKRKEEKTAEEGVEPASGKCLCCKDLKEKKPVEVWWFWCQGQSANTG